MMRNTRKVRLALVCASIIGICLMFAGIGHAKIDIKTVAGLWLLDEDDGDIAKDSTENGNDGSIVGNAKWIDGKFGTALELDGGTAALDIPFEAIDINKDQTFSVWFKTEIDADIHARVLHVSMAAGYRLWMFIYRSGHGMKGQMGFGYRNGENLLHMNNGTPLNDGTWHHAVSVFDHATKQASLYIDGKRSTQKTIAGMEFNASLGKLCIGSAGPGSFLPGEIDEVAVFNVALKEEDIQAIMNKGLDGALGLTAVEPGGKLATIWAATKAR